MFRINAIKPDDKQTAVFLYDPTVSTLTYEDGRSVISLSPTPSVFEAALVTSPDQPAGKKSPSLLKISLGLSCNYSCEYCSQRFVPRAAETSHADIADFIGGLDSWVTAPPEQIEFWGGEPLVYWKTLKPLAETLRRKYPDTEFSMVTNGSLLTKEINDWIVSMRFRIAISHDGPGQAVRGPDPLENAETKEAILSLYRRLRPLGRFSFSAVLNRSNMSRAEIAKFFVDLTGDADVLIGEGAIVDSYDEGGLAMSLRDSDHAAFRNRAFVEIRSGSAKNFDVIRTKIASFADSIRQGRPAAALWQKCGMDRETSVAVDLRGNVLTCQNTSAKGVAPNGNSHLIGTTKNLDEVRLTTATHWSKRKDCSNCPVVHLCGGACMFLDGHLWDVTCNNAFSDNVVLFAAAIEFLTGYVPVRIEGGRPDREDIWNPSGAAQPRKVVPINKVTA
jgi:uncharacterized protein